MKFDLFSWSEKHGTFEARKGRVQILFSRPAALYASAEGVEALVGYGTSFDLETTQVLIFRADGPKDLRVFVHQPHGTSIVSEGEVYTNIDRMPDESGSLAEVTHARRILEIERRAMLREIRQEREKTLNAMRGVRHVAQDALAARQADQVPDPAAASVDGAAE